MSANRTGLHSKLGIFYGTVLSFWDTLQDDGFDFVDRTEAREAPGNDELLQPRKSNTNLQTYQIGDNSRSMSNTRQIKFRKLLEQKVIC